MKKTSTFLLLGMLLAACNVKPDRPAQIKVVNAVAGGQQVLLSLKNQQQSLQMVLPYGSIKELNSFPSAHTSISLQSAGTNKPLLQQDMGMGNEDEYLLLFTGNANLSQHLNQETSQAAIHRIFAGAESENANAYLPKMTLIDNKTKVKPDESKVRVINAFSGKESFEVLLKKDGEEKSLDFEAAYPKVTDFKSTQPGSYTLVIKYPFVKAPLLSKNIQVKGGFHYSLILIGNEIGQSSISYILTEDKGAK